MRGGHFVYHESLLETQPDHVRAMLPPHSPVCDQMPVSLETLGADILLEVVSWLSRFDLLNFVMTVRSLVSILTGLCYPSDNVVLVVV